MVSGSTYRQVRPALENTNLRSGFKLKSAAASSAYHTCTPLGRSSVDSTLWHLLINGMALRAYITLDRGHP